MVFAVGTHGKNFEECREPTHLHPHQYRRLRATDGELVDRLDCIETHTRAPQVVLLSGIGHSPLACLLADDESPRWLAFVRYEQCVVASGNMERVIHRGDDHRFTEMPGRCVVISGVPGFG